ncbi:formate dehydrogenase accessory sulfurtransferase FdhD [Phyllobacterium sp. 21LDTY02-6]|uniref:formate dehydrogenase accessory sulfurtransferase FdhD n=1 Tax=Phyllobacterium sp. 21LDTY02-6 TaxID=2944903 RepID=UPI0021127F5A|nr:formate dehydrogenase accessory sulfurtransferase FdhD [Phyllobacterium sp. 21LDTY02-6]
MASRPTRVPVKRVTRRDAAGGGFAGNQRLVPEETPVAFSYGGTTHAVMMATPADLEDFAVGFSLSEGIIRGPDEIETIEVEDHAEGIDVQIRLAGEAGQDFTDRRRRMAGPVGCGLCGIESIEQALKPVATVAATDLRLTAANIAEATRLLADFQPLHKDTGAAHAAGFYIPDKGIVMAREDVGRHNALDKLAGGLCRGRIDGRAGAVVITSRVSVEMVQKTAIIGASVLIAVSAPTALAIRTAEQAGMTLVALVRASEFDVFTRPDRLGLAPDGRPIRPDDHDQLGGNHKHNPDPAASTLVQSPTVKLVQYG